MRALVKILIGTIAVFVTANLLTGVRVENFRTALIVAVVLSVINAIVKPVLVFLTLPLTVLTFGLFLLVINALLIQLAAWLVPGFFVAGFWWALLFSLIVSLIGWVLNGLTEKSLTDVKIK